MKSKYLIYTSIMAVLTFNSSCTKLEEEFRGELEEGSGEVVDPGALLTSSYTAFNVPYQQEQRWVLQEISTDAAMAPTRGGDWDDNGMH
ncbi:MAG: RagB/SusD family nutrient uptake outer membrane protein, partial [Sphingobacterium sp.]